MGLSCSHAGLWQLVRMLLACGSCFVRPRLRPWQRTRSQGPAGGVSSAPMTLMEALETEQLPSPGPSPSPPSASLLPVTPNPLFSQRLTRLHSADLSPLRSPGGGPLGLHPHPQQVPHSAGAELRGHVRAAFILALQSLGSFPESSQPSDFPPNPRKKAS